MLSLSRKENARLRELEAVIKTGRKIFVQVGAALDEIRTRRLYRYTHRTFEAYCRERWGFSKPWAYRQMKAARYATMVPMGTKPPENERQARAVMSRSLSPRRPSVRLKDFMSGRLGAFEHQQVADAIVETRDARKILEGVRDVPEEVLNLYNVAINYLEAWLAGEQSAMIAAKEKMTGEDIIAVEKQTRSRRAVLNAISNQEAEEDTYLTAQH